MYVSSNRQIVAWSHALQEIQPEALEEADSDLEGSESAAVT